MHFDLDCFGIATNLWVENQVTGHSKRRDRNLTFLVELKTSQRRVNENPRSPATLVKKGGLLVVLINDKKENVSQQQGPTCDFPVSISLPPVG